MRIERFKHSGESVALLPDSAMFDYGNTYTVVVGRNGVGKSRLLSSIAKELIEYSDYEEYNFEGEPLVIAVSTSPFDKFPSGNRTKTRPGSNYRYIGLRGDTSFAASSSMSLISSAAKGLLSGALQRSDAANLADVFSALSFDSIVVFMLKPGFDRAVHETHPDKYDEYFLVEPVESNGRIRVDKRFESVFSKLSLDERSSVEYAMSNVSEFYQARRALEIVYDFKTQECYFDGRPLYPHLVNSLAILMKHGFIRLMDLILNKRDHGSLSLRRASSGEQCLMVIMLGIAGHIRDDSVILIDEPEISLHPHWQEQFMPMLISAFSKYNGCQFVIATHSPQIVSNTVARLSYVLTLEDLTLHDAEDFNNRSADFQLAEIFGAPGRMNEYVSRLGFNLIAKLRSRGRVDAEIAEGLNELVAFKGKLVDGDPVKKLIVSVEELASHYASN